MAETRNHTGHRCGISHHAAKLTSEQAKEMRKKYEAQKFSYARLARIFSCGISTARDIVLYRTRWNG